MVVKAQFQTPLTEGRVRCDLCPRSCIIAPGKTGFCKVRRNDDGCLSALTFNHPVAIQSDPVEKKPLAYFLPGTYTFSIGTYGCNLDCCFCQNWDISRGGYGSKSASREERLVFLPEDIVEGAIQQGCKSVAFTYNEPTVFVEYAMAIARLAHQAKLKTILVSNGWINLESAREFYPLIDAANIDVKGFSEAFYQDMCKAGLAPVLRSCEYFRRELGGHLELTNLVIPGKNDSPEMIDALLDWVEQSLGLDTPIHFTAYFPMHRCEIPPTSREKLFTIREHATQRGFSRICLGNIR